MGYVHDTAMSKFIVPDACHFVTGTWAMAAGAITNTIAMSRTAGDASTTITIPLDLYQSSIQEHGSKLVSITVWFKVMTAALDAMDALIYKATLPAQGAEFGAPESLTFEYDVDHDEATERIIGDEHKMTLTLATPIWLDNDDLVTVEIIIDAAGSSAITFFGARANYTLRV